MHFKTQHWAEERLAGGDTHIMAHLYRTFNVQSNTVCLVLKETSVYRKTTTRTAMTSSGRGPGWGMQMTEGPEAPSSLLLILHLLSWSLWGLCHSQNLSELLKLSSSPFVHSEFGFRDRQVLGEGTHQGWRK